MLASHHIGLEGLPERLYDRRAAHQAVRFHLQVRNRRVASDDKLELRDLSFGITPDFCLLIPMAVFQKNLTQGVHLDDLHIR